MPYGYRARGPLALPGERCAPCRAEGLMWEVMGHLMIGSSPGGEDRKASLGRGTSLRPGNRRAQHEYIHSQTGSGLDRLEVGRKEWKVPSPCTPKGQPVTDCVTVQRRGL